MASLTAGKMDRRLTLSQRSVTVNSMNEPVESWATLATVWAEREDLSDGEKVRAQQVGSEITTRFRIRWSSVWSSLNPKDRCTCESREYEITGLKELGRREGIEITATARTDQSGLYS